MQEDYPQNPYSARSSLVEPLVEPLLPPLYEKLNATPNNAQYHTRHNHPPQPLTAELLYPPLPNQQASSPLGERSEPNKSSNARNTEYIIFITQTIHTKQAANSNDRLCPGCSREIRYPRTKRVAGTVALSYCVCLLITTCVCFICPLCCCDNCKDVVLYCQSCGHRLGSIKAECC